jgi:hypothetical protein
MHIWINEGETLTVSFTSCDGEIVLSYTDNTLRVAADIPDTSGRAGVIYEEELGTDAELKPEATSEDVAPLTLEEYRGWSKYRQEGLQYNVGAGLSRGKSYDDTILFEGKRYMIGYVKQFIDLVNAEEAEAEVSK